LSALVSRFSDLSQLIPETKGLSLEQVDILYRNSPVLKSATYRRTILENDMHDEEIVNHDRKHGPQHLEEVKRQHSDVEQQA
jgi:hypothetical protein